MFSSREFLTDAVMARLTEIRVTDPERAWRAAEARTRRDRLAPSGKLNILAADHPARRVTKVGDNPIAMADRQDYLARILRVLSAEGMDGLMATMDILEDLFILDSCVREAGGASLLDGKVLIGSLNRGGLAGASWELDDPITGPTPATCAAWRLDGAKTPPSHRRRRAGLAQDHAGQRPGHHRVQRAAAARCSSNPCPWSKLPPAGPCRKTASRSRASPA